MVDQILEADGKHAAACLPGILELVRNPRERFLRDAAGRILRVGIDHQHAQRIGKPGDVAQFKDIKDASLTTLPTSRFVQDNSFLRLNALTLTYDFNREWLKRNLGLRMLRLEASTSDLINWNSVRQERGLSYPKSYKFNFSVKAQF